MITENKDAKTAFEVALRLKGGTLEVSDNELKIVWDKCHEQEILEAVSLYVYATPSYAAKALEKLKKDMSEEAKLEK